MKVRYYLVCFDDAEFRAWCVEAVAAGRVSADLQHCNQLVTVEDFAGLRFDSPHTELLISPDWRASERARGVEGAKWRDAVLIARLFYCRDKRVVEVPPLRRRF